MDETIKLETEDDIDQIVDLCKEKIGDSVFNDREYEVIIKPVTKSRTLLQNASMHKWLTDLAKELNAAGYSQKKLLNLFKDGFELPTTMNSLKEIVQEVCLAMYGTRKTSKLKTVQMMKMYEAVDLRFSEVTGCHVEWPSKQSQEDEARGLKK